MLHLNRQFLAVILVTGGVFVRPIAAAPAVRNFANATSTSAYGNMRGTSKSLQTQTVPTVKSASSARSLSLTAKPTTTKAIKGTYVGTPQISTSIDSARTPGKHSSLVKGISSKVKTAVTIDPEALATLERRLDELEAGLAAKQDALEFGDGINVDGNTISLATEITDLPENVETIAQGVEDLNGQISNNNYYTQEEIEQIVYQITNSNVVTEFDPSIFSLGQGGQH